MKSAQLQDEARAQTIADFYSAFQGRDHLAMQQCYHAEISFSDPVFEGLRGKAVAAMWHMLCEAGKDLQITFGGVVVNGEAGKAHWEARYSFSRTGRAVHNTIDARFRFSGNKIIEHADSFDLWKWTRMALGAPGLLLGWTPVLRSRVRTTAAENLRRFVAQHPEYREDS